MLEKIVNPLDNNIYKISLFIIKKGNFNFASRELSKKENITFILKAECIKEILVQKTISNNYVKEILTGTLIPVKIESITKKRDLDVNFFLQSIERTEDKNTYTRNMNYPVTCINKIDSPVYVKRMIMEDNHYKSYTFNNGDLKLLSDCIATKKDLIKYHEENNDVFLLKQQLEDIFKEGEIRYSNSLSKVTYSDDESIKKLVKIVKK